MKTNLRTALSGLARQPIVHFLVIGIAIGGLYAWLGNRNASEPDRTIRVSAGEIGRMEAEWRARWNRPPTPQELDGLVRARVREAALYREAVAMGMNQDDPVIRRILVQKLEGIARDLVELGLSPTEQDLATYFAEHADRYRPPPLITFTHVFVDPDRRDERTLEDAGEILAELQRRGPPTEGIEEFGEPADEILAELQRLGPPTEGIEEFGDPFMLQRYYPEKDQQRIASLFGHGFAGSVFELEPRKWHGPVLSGYGTHLVYVDALTEFPTPELADVDDNRTRITTDYFDQLLARYEVIVERESANEPADEPADAALAQAP